MRYKEKGVKHKIWHKGEGVNTIFITRSFLYTSITDRSFSLHFKLTEQSFYVVQSTLFVFTSQKALLPFITNI